MGLTRRISAIERGYYKIDDTLVRHIHDLHEIEKLNVINEMFKELVRNVVERDKVQFKDQCPEFFENPEQETKMALDILSERQMWRENYYNFVRDMVYKKEPASYDEGLATLSKLKDLTS